MILGHGRLYEPRAGARADRRQTHRHLGVRVRAYEMLVGQPALDVPQSPTPSPPFSSANRIGPHCPATPISVERLLRRCLEKSRKRRLRDIGDARHALDEIEMTLAAIRARSHVSAARWLACSPDSSSRASSPPPLTLWMRGEHPSGYARRSGPQFSRLTTDAAIDRTGPSRDGTMVVYASDRAGNGQLDLWLQRSAGGQPVPLTNDPADDRSRTSRPTAAHCLSIEPRRWRRVGDACARRQRPSRCGSRASTAVFSRRQPNRVLDGTVAHWRWPPRPGNRGVRRPGERR